MVTRRGGGAAGRGALLLPVVSLGGFQQACNFRAHVPGLLARRLALFVTDCNIGPGFDHGFYVFGKNATHNCGVPLIVFQIQIGSAFCQRVYSFPIETCMKESRFPAVITYVDVSSCIHEFMNNLFGFSSFGFVLSDGEQGRFSVPAACVYYGMTTQYLLDDFGTAGFCRMNEGWARAISSAGGYVDICSFIDEELCQLRVAGVCSSLQAAIELLFWNCGFAPESMSYQLQLVFAGGDFKWAGLVWRG
jgi:hypothetical protein